jgi:hypothetical protein
MPTDTCMSRHPCNAEPATGPGGNQQQQPCDPQAAVTSTPLMRRREYVHQQHSHKPSRAPQAGPSLRGCMPSWQIRQRPIGAATGSDNWQADKPGHKQHCKCQKERVVATPAQTCAHGDVTWHVPLRRHGRSGETLICTHTRPQCVFMAAARRLGHWGPNSPGTTAHCTPGGPSS